MITLPEIRIVLRDAGPRRDVERSVGRRQCTTVVAGCTVAEAPGRAHLKAWHGPGEQIGNTVCIPQKRKRSGALTRSAPYTRLLIALQRFRAVPSGYQETKNIP